MRLREYQVRAIEKVRKEWESARSVLICAPTGGGKTAMMSGLLHGFRDPIWAAHRVDLVEQTRERVDCRVESVQSLASKRQLDLSVDLLVADEAHNIKSATWNKVVQLYPNAKILGGTATPQRSDGQPLGDVFERLVVAANYGELLRDGFLVPCRVFKPAKQIENGIALDPVEAYFRYAPGMKGFVFVSTVKQAAQLNERFNARGVKSDVLHGFTHKKDRKQLIDDLRSGCLDLIINCTALTEGTDVVNAQVCILARRCVHSGLYLQIVGRVLRASPGKQHAVLLDLTGASRHGLPTDDREYSLKGTAIRQSQAQTLRTCYLCGAVMLASARSCISCATPFVPGVHKPPTIHNVGLREVYAGSETVDSAKQGELDRLCSKHSWPAAAKQFEKLFGARPSQTQWSLVPREAELTEWKRMLKSRTSQQASVIMKSYTGRWPAKFGVTA